MHWAASDASTLAVLCCVSEAEAGCGKKATAPPLAVVRGPAGGALTKARFYSIWLRRAPVEAKSYDDFGSCFMGIWLVFRLTQGKKIYI